MPKIRKVVLQLKVITSITNLFFSVAEQNKTDTHFGILIGPSRSGNTNIITELYNKYPEGVLYYEINEGYSFCEQVKQGDRDEDNTQHHLEYAWLHAHYTLCGNTNLWVNSKLLT